MYLFDTSAVIEWLNSERLGKIIDGPVATSVLTLSELLPYAKLKGKKTESSLEDFLRDVTILPIDETIARKVSNIKFELLKKGEEKSLIDIFIAVAAVHHGYSLVTLDSDFEEIIKITKGELVFIN